MPVTVYTNCTPCCSGAGNNVVSGACCSGTLLPLTLHGTITNDGTLNGSYAFYYVSGSPSAWYTSGAVGTCGSGLRVDAALGTCDLQKFNGISWVAVPSTGGQTVQSCSPFDLIVSGVGDCGAAGWNMVITT